MKKHIVSFILLLAVCAGVKAQFSVNYSFGVGTYDMGQMKDLMKELREGFLYNGLPVALVDNFPAYVTHQLELAYMLKRHEFGFKSTYMTTGGKLAYADYSGELSYEMTMNGFKQELFYRFYLLNRTPGLNLYIEAAPGLIFNKLKNKTYAKIYDYPESETINSDGINASFTPGIGVKYMFNSFIGLRASAGYQIDIFDAKVNLKTIGYGIRCRSNWSGLRLSTGISLYLK